LTANLHRKPGRPPFKVEDFMPRDEESEAPRAPMSTLFDMLRGLAARR
jgi:hypothetical protein